MTGTARAEAAHVTCVGDSITFGAGTTTPATDSYPAQLQTLLGTGVAVQNDGHSGATLLVNGDLPYTGVAEYTASTTWAAAGGDVVIQLGTNDSKPANWTVTNKAAFEADCESLVAHYQTTAGKPRVWVNLPPPAFDPSCCTISSTVIKDEVIPLLKQCAAAKGASTIDVFAALTGQSAHFSDGVHPDNAGALLIAQAVQAALVKTPTVSLSATAASFSASVPVTLTANAVAAYGKIEQIEIFEDTKSLAKSTTPNVNLNLAAGTHALYAVVTETGGRTAKSSPPISVVVEAEPSKGQPPPPPPSPSPSPAPGASPSPSPDGGASSAVASDDGGGCSVVSRHRVASSVVGLGLIVGLAACLRRRRK